MKDLATENLCAPLRMDMLRAGHADEIAVFEEGVHAFTDCELQRIADGAMAGRHAICGASRNSICYKISAGMHGSACAVLKQAGLAAGRTNPDHTFKHEADNLMRLAGLEIPGCPVLLARFRSRGTYYLLLTFVPGEHPHPCNLPLKKTLLRQLFDTFFLMDRSGFIHYDLQASNIVLSQDRAGLIDFEFAGQASPLAEQDDAYLCDYNICSNPAIPLRSCVCNFEFRTLFRYLAALRSTAPAGDVLAFARTYLGCRADYHARMAAHFAAAAGNRRGRPAQRLRRASRHEERLAALLRNPSAGVLTAEYLVMKLRFELFERDFNACAYDLEAGFSHARFTLERLVGRNGRRGSDCPGWYIRSCLMVLDKLERKAAAGAGHELPGGHC